jgi:hypothetical protein
MATWTIEQREAGDPADGPLAWIAIARIEASNPSTALHEFCIAQRWYAHQIIADQAVVQGVGHFRVSLEDDDPTLVEFVIQRQDPIGPDDRHVTWSDIAVVHASDPGSALGRYLDTLGSVNISWRSGHAANLIGIGDVRAVRAELADDLRVTPAPRLDEPL